MIADTVNNRIATITTIQPIKATDLYLEGLVLPPTKLRKAGQDDEGVINIIRANVLPTQIMLGDLHAEEAATLN